MKKLMFLMALTCSFHFVNADAYHMNGEETELTDQAYYFKKIFGNLKVRTFLEFGVGDSTRYCLDSCNKVISVDFITNGYGPDAFKKYLDLYRDYSNWVPLAYFTGYLENPTWAPYKYLGSESVYKAASYQSATHRNYALMDDFYVTELNAFIGSLVRFHPIDVAFVNMAGVVIRGDVVQCLFGKIPVIVAQGTAVRMNHVKDDLYGYSRVVTPEDYDEIYLSSGGGATIWILKNEKYNAVAEVCKLNSHTSSSY